MAWSHSADTTGSVGGTVWTPVASDTADEDDVALHRAAIPNAPSSGDGPHRGPPAPSAARAAHPTRPLGREARARRWFGRAAPRSAAAAAAARERREAAMVG